jgi:hypothetical protein
MEQVEQRLDVGLSPQTDHTRIPVRNSERAQLLELATRLAEPGLGVESRLDLVDRMYSVLNHDPVSKCR